ncbi:Molybdenum cofactor guanylyltransferase [Bienertia sinuspersici]
MGCFGALCWAAWHCGSTHIFEQIQPNAVQVAVGSARLVGEYNAYAGKVFGGGVNTDASVVAGQHTALGVVVRDCEGRVVAMAARKLEGEWEVECAEAATAAYGVRNQAHGYAPSFLFYDEILSAKECFDSFSCYHVKRGGNAVAHYVVRWDINVSEEIMYTDNFPQSIVSLAVLDMK